MKNFISNVTVFSLLSFTMISANALGMSRNIGELANYSKVDEVILLPSVGIFQVLRTTMTPAPTLWCKIITGNFLNTIAV